jgi:ParB family chromosome partitioning protein
LELRLIEVTRIVEDPDQPRRAIDDAALAGLADSIRQHGILNPITVAPLGGVDGFRIVTGERRWRASQIAGLFEMPCIVREEPVGDTTDKTTEQLIENLQREELAPLDKARAIRTLKETLDANNREVGQRLGLSERTVGYLLDLLDLPEAIGEQIVSSPNRPSDGNLTEKHGRFLKAFNHERELQEHLVEKIRGEKLSADATGQIAKALKENPDLRDEILAAAAEELPNLLREKGRGGDSDRPKREREPDYHAGAYDGGPYVGGDDEDKPLFSNAQVFAGLVGRAAATLSEVKIGTVPKQDLPAVEDALLRVKESVDRLLSEVRAARGGGH